MGSLEYKERLNRFGSDLKDVRELLYEAVTEKVSAKKREAALLAGRRKLDEWAGLVDQLDDLKKAQAEERFGEQVQKIQQRVKALS